jgi:hypothetical protein
MTLAASSLGMAATLVRAEAERSREGAPHPGREGEATEKSEVRSVCWRRGKKTPTLRAHVRGRRTVWRAERQDGKRVVQQRSTEAFASVVKHSVPRSNARSPRLRARPRGESRGASREHTRYGYTFIVQVADVGRTHRASCSLLCRSQGLLERQGASQKEARKSRLTGGTSRETAKRCAEKRSRIKQYALVRHVGLGSHALDTTEDVLGLSPGLPSRVSRREVLRLEGESQPSCLLRLSQESRTVRGRRTAHRTAQRPFGCAFG